jgi:hypothetical protein
MEPISIPSLMLAIFFWVGYFTVVAFICHIIYMKLRGTPPASPNLTVTVNGKPMSALTAWEARDQRLQRLILAIAIALALLPLVLPWMLRMRP